MREQAERCRPCFDENVLGKEWLNLSALETWLHQQLLLLLLRSLLSDSCLLVALPDSAGREQPAGKGVCTRQSGDFEQGGSDPSCPDPRG